MIFDLFCYAVAVVSVLAFVGSGRKRSIAAPTIPAAPTAPAVPDLSAIPDESVVLPVEELQVLQAATAPKQEEEPVTAPRQVITLSDSIVPFNRLAKSTTVVDLEAVAELIAIGQPGHATCYQQSFDLPVHTLRTLGSLYEVRGARRWSKAEAVKYWRSVSEVAA